MNKTFFGALLLSILLTACGGGGGAAAGGDGALPPQNPSSGASHTQNASTVTSGPLSACASISLPTPAGSTSASCTVSDTNFTGTLNFQDGASCAGIVALTPTTSNGPSTSFTATQIGAGACHVAVSDSNGHSVSVAVSSTVTSTTITVPGPLETCGSLSLPVDGSQSASCFVSEAGYGGTFTVDASACAGIVTLSPSSVNGPNAYVTASQVGGGSCTVKITDSKGNAATIQIGSTWVNATVSMRDTLRPEVHFA